MIKIIDIESGVNLDLPRDIKISFEITNPMFTDQGSASLPVKLENTKNNKKFFGFPERLDLRKCPVTQKKVLIISGVYNQIATLHLNSVDSEGNYNCVLLINESILYLQLNNVRLVDVFKNIIRTEYSTPKEWVAHLDKVMCGDVSDDFYVFPVCTEIKDGDKPAYDFINYTGCKFGNQAKKDKSGKYYDPLLANISFAVNIDGKNITYPIGYGVSPFLKLTYVLTQIFRHFGYDFSESEFDNYPEFKKMVVVNNTYDAIMLGKIKYDQLVPSCNVTEFLNDIRMLFGCEFKYIESEKKVKLIFWNEFLKNMNDVSEIKKEKSLTINYAMPKKIKLTSQHSNDKNNSAYRTYQDILELGKFFKQNELTYENIPGFVPDIIPPNGVYFDRKKLLLRQGFYTYNGEKVVRDLTFDTLDYIPNDANFGIEEKNSTSEVITMISIGSESFLVPFEGFQIKYFYPYIGKSRKLNTIIEFTNIADSRVKKEEVKCPVLFCFYRGRRVNEWAGENSMIFGTTYAFDEDGNLYTSLPEQRFNLTYGGELGLYEKFWKIYDEHLQSSFKQVTGQITLSQLDLKNFDMMKKYAIDSQHLLPLSIKYEMTHNDIKVVQAEFLTLKKYQ